MKIGKKEVPEKLAKKIDERSRQTGILERCYVRYAPKKVTSPIVFGEDEPVNPKDDHCLPVEKQRGFWRRLFG